MSPRLLRHLGIGICLLVAVAAPNMRAAQGARGGAPRGQASAPAPPAPATGVILGQVIDASGGQPIDGAIVSLNGGNSGASLTIVDGRLMRAPAPPSSPRRVMADNQGRFMFFNLPAGSYSMSVSASGYLNGAYGQTAPNGMTRQLVLKDDQKTGNAVVQLWRLAAVSGTVRDENGDPIINEDVRLLRRQGANGRATFSIAGSSRTDDRGMYRLGGVSPGAYLVAVPAATTTMPMSVVAEFQRLQQQSAGDGGEANRAFSMQLNASNAPFPTSSGMRLGGAFLQTQGPMPVPSAQRGRMYLYQTMFFPESTAASHATVITLGPGEERGSVDFQLKAVPTFKVAGTLTAADGQAARLGVKLLPEPSGGVMVNSLENFSTITEGDGSFTFLGVPPGSYVLTIVRVPRPVMQRIAGPAPGPLAGSGGLGFAGDAPQRMLPPTDPTLFAEVPVAVADADVAGLTVSLQTGPRVSGRVVFDGAAPKPPLDRVPSPVNVNLVSAGDVRSFSGPIVPPVIDPNGQFTTMSMPPGKYLVSAGAPGWLLESAIVDGRDVSQLPLDLQAGDVSGLVVTFFDRPAQITGVVRNAQGAAVDSATVLVLPANYRALADGGNPIRRQSRTGPDGKYAAGGLLPGEYLIAATSDDFTNTADPVKALDAIASAATRVTIGEGEKHSQDLSLSTVTIR